MQCCTYNPPDALSSSLLHNYSYNLNINIFSMKDNTKMNLDAINILKGLAYSQLEVELS